MTNEKWELVKLGDVVTLINGRAYSKNELLSDGKYPILRVGNFFSNDDWYYSNLELDENKYCDDGDLLFAWSASFGPKIWMGGKVIYHYHIWKMILSDSVYKEYLYYYLQDISDKIKQQSHGVTMAHITKNEMEKILIRLPPLPEQQRIASILSAADKAIEEAGLAVEESERIKIGLMQKLITNSESRNYILNDVILEYLNGGTPSTKKPEYWNGDIHWTTSANLNGYYLNSGEKKITQDGLKHSSTNLVPMGNIIIATRVGLGKSVINCVDIAISQDLTGLILDQSKIDREYLAHYLKSDKVIQKIINSAQGTTIKGITRDALGNIPLLLPTLSKQKRIAACLSTADEKISLCKKRKALLEKTKLGLMQKLLS